MALPFEKIEDKLSTIIKTDAWSKIGKTYVEKKTILLFGHGGNFAVCSHSAIDMNRLCPEKTVLSPNGGVWVTSLISDTGYMNWLKEWCDLHLRNTPAKDCMAIGLSCSVGSESNNVIRSALSFTSEKGVESFLWASQNQLKPLPGVNELITECMYYHSHEVLCLMLFYQMIYEYSHGKYPPKICYPVKGCETCDYGALDHSFCDDKKDD